ncbi:hypothetical protein GW916_01975, partial [bacterium]|nr:hypothetical protein [bacterium]
MKRLLSRISLSLRIGLIILTYSLGVVVVSGIAVLGFEKVKLEVKKSIQQLAINSTSLVGLQSAMDETGQTYQLIVAENGANGLEQLKELRQIKSQFLESLKKLEEDNKSLKWLPEKIVAIKSDFDQLDEYGKQMTLGFLRQDEGLVSANQAQLDKTISNIRANILSINDRFTQQTEESIFSEIKMTEITMALAGGLGLLFAFGLAFLILKITRSEIESISVRLKGASSNNVKSTNNIESMLRSVSDITHQQAASTQKTSSALNQISSMVQMSAKDALDSSKKAKSSQEQ